MEQEATIQSYQDLIVYQKAYALAIEVYRITSSFPSSELYGLVSRAGLVRRIGDIAFNLKRPWLY